MVNDYRALNFTSIGASHIKNGTVCQDSSAKAENESYRLAVICDGHGGADYFRSDRGSRFAVKAFCLCMEDPDLIKSISECKNQKQIDERIRWFIRSVITRWNIFVEQDINSEPFSEEEMKNISDKARKHYEKGEKIQSAYGTTLIGTVITDSFWFGIQIGDGKCVAFDKEGNAVQPIPWDEQCFLNTTTSICDSNAGGEFRHFFSRDIPAAVFVGSDGIDDCFAGDKRLHNFYRLILTSFAESEMDTACKQLENYLPELSKQGSGDDMSIGCLLNIGYIKNNPDVFKKKKEPYLKIIRIGNLGSRSLDSDYTQKQEIEAVPGDYRLDMIGCGGFGTGIMSFKVLSADDKSIVIHIAGKEYTVTSQEDIEIVKRNLQEYQIGWTECDRLIFQFILK